MSKLYTYLTLPESDDDRIHELELEIVVDYDCDYEPARGMGGPWEDSSPAAGDMTLNGFELDGPAPAGVTMEMLNTAYLAAEDRITDQAWEHYHD